MFVTNFYAYLNYDTRRDFVVSLDRVWKWLGYSRIDHCKTALIKYCKENIDYRVDIPEKLAPEVGGAKNNEANEDHEEKTEKTENNKKVFRFGKT